MNKLYAIDFYRTYEEENKKEKRTFYVYAETKEKAKRRMLNIENVKNKDIIDVRLIRQY